MRLSQPRSSAALAAAALLSSTLPLVSAVPYARDDLHDAGYGYLVPRECNGGYCGSANDLCCGVDQACTTVEATPTCIEYAELKARDELWARDVYTTTWTETKTYTRTVSSQEQVATTAIVYEKCVPPDGSGQKACGNVCCGSWQYCAYEGQCLDSASAAAGGAASGAVSGAVSGGGGGYITTTVSGVRTTMYSAPYKVTSGASITSTTTATANGTAIAATGGGGGLSGGAIAGIVIGVIAGVILLLLLCFCCLVRGAWGAVSGIFGRKRKSEREKIVVEEESYVRHNVGAAASAHGRRERHGSWYDDGRVSAAAARKKEGGKGLLGMAAGLGTLALLLGLKRDKQSKPSKSHRSRSSYSSSYFTDSYTRSGTSSASSGGRTRQSRGSRGTRTTRHTRTSRRSSRR